VTPGDRIARANRARDLIENDLKDTFESVRMALLERLEACPIGDRDAQHEIALTLQLLKQLKQHLLSYVQDGKLAEKEVEQKTWLEKAKKRFA
jgi:hypothetical protein